MPLILKLAFWSLVAACILVGVDIIRAGSTTTGLLVSIAAPVVIGVYCKLLVLLFRTRDEIRDLQNAGAEPKPVDEGAQLRVARGPRRASVAGL